MKPILMIDFGSTNTKVTAVDLEEGKLLGTAASYTTVQTDVNEGLDNALQLLSEKIGTLEYEQRYACSSAAGGLKMISCGLVPELTAEAARQASLGAGAKVMKVYSYQLTEDDAEEIQQLAPDIFLLTGGTDGGNKENIIENARMLAQIPLNFPIVVAGNRAAARTCERILTEAGKQVKVCENVMPRFNQLNIGPAQAMIREVFLERIIKAKGLSKASQLISGIMMPTPAAVLAAMELLSKGTENQPGLANLLTIQSALTKRPIEEIIREFEGKGYGDLKKAIGQTVFDFLSDLQSKYKEVVDSGLIDTVLKEGAEKANRIANKKINK
ncbi:MAG: glutamate mutase L, partial [Firmicutes bacterium]|nr:glutamate mutase L [Bacillota bacterium]